MVVIDYQNRKPIYEQIVERFQMLIVKGILEPDSQMPSVRALATERLIQIRYRKLMPYWNRRGISIR